MFFTRSSISWVTGIELLEVRACSWSVALDGRDGGEEDNFT